MITIIKGKFQEGEIYEIEGHSEPLYLFHNGELKAITPIEYNLCTITEPKKRWLAICNLQLFK